MGNNNTKFIITARDKEMTHYLLNHYKIKYYNRGKGSDNFIGKLLYLIIANIKLLIISLKHQPDIFLSFGSPYAAQVSYILRKYSITLDDTENAKLGQLFYRFFTNKILSPICFSKNFGYKHLKFNGYMELSYLHPKYFNPNEEVLSHLKLTTNDCFTFIRFVKWKANHDLGHTGISIENKFLAVEKFSKYGKVFVSSEEILPPKFDRFLIKIPKHLIHSVLFYASLVYGESATMASESAVLGTPSIYIDNDGRGYTDEQEKVYGLVSNFSESEKDQIKSIKKGVQILSDNFKSEYDNKRQSLLSDKIDVTEFLINQLEKERKNSRL
jgi:predicted glycosyltransferase